MRLYDILGRSGKAPEQSRRRHARLPVASLAVVSWESEEGPRELRGSCIDLSEGGAGINVGELLPLSTHVHVRFPELQAEADGEVRRVSEASIGIEFTDLVYYGRHRISQKAAPPQDPEKYVMAALGLTLFLTVAYGIPGLLPDWVPYSRRPPLAAVRAPNFFTLGSSKPEVYTLQGPPTRMTESTWYYGSSRVSFRGNFVVGWFVSPDHPLSTGAERLRSTADHLDGFTTGSTAAEVLATQGPPTELTDDVWKYGSSEVYFRDGKVAGWRSTAKDPLKAESPDAKRQTRASAGKKESDAGPQPKL